MLPYKNVFGKQKVIRLLDTRNFSQKLAWTIMFEVGVKTYFHGYFYHC